MTQTLTTKVLNDFITGQGYGVAPSAVEAMARELLANREAQPVEDEIYAELYSLRIENKGPDGFETWKDAAVFERIRRANVERKLSGEEMTYLEAASLLTSKDAQNLSAIEASRRGASYNGKINAHIILNSMRYQYLRDKDAFGAENEPGLAGWDELIELDGNEFDAAIDARMTHHGIAFTAPPAPAVQSVVDWRLDESTGAKILMYKDCSVIEDQQAEYVLSLIQAAAPGGGNG
ncbi:hypothetical protein ACAY19_000823 [Serratia liquefaciens]